MTWRIAAVVVALIAVVAANALLLAFGSNHKDPVGRLSPIAQIQLGSSRPSSPQVASRPTRTEDD